jgi:hypothetical protein
MEYNFEQSKTLIYQNVNFYKIKKIIQTLKKHKPDKNVTTKSCKSIE